MNIKLMESLKKIANDKETLKQIENSDCSLIDIYDICKEYGFTDSYEVFEKDYEELFAYLINEIKEEELSSVSGGKMNRFFSKSTATLLSTLTLSTTAIPMSSAANHNNPKSTSEKVNFVRKNPGKSLPSNLIAGLAGVATLPVGVLIYAGISKLLPKEIVVNGNYLNKMENYINNLGSRIKDADKTLEKHEIIFPSDFEIRNLFDYSYSSDILSKDYANMLERNIGNDEVLDCILLKLSKLRSSKKERFDFIANHDNDGIKVLKNCKDLEEAISKFEDKLNTAINGLSEKEKQLYSRIVEGHNQYAAEKIGLNIKLIDAIGQKCFIDSLKREKSHGYNIDDSINGLMKNESDYLDDLDNNISRVSNTMIFFYTLRQYVKDNNTRMKIYDSLKRKDYVSSANSKKLMSYIIETLKENHIELKLS